MFCSPLEFLKFFEHEAALHEAASFSFGHVSDMSALSDWLRFCAMLAGRYGGHDKAKCFTTTSA